MNLEIYKVSTIVDSAVQGVPLDKAQIKYLLGLEDKTCIGLLNRAARTVREKHFGSGIFVYGFLYFSTHCRNNCRFCHFRNANYDLVRYRKTQEEIVESARNLADSGVHLIDLTMGEDPELFDSEQGAEKLLRMIRAVGLETGLPLMISPGAVPDSLIKAFGNTGVDWFACYQETHSRSLFELLRKDQSYDLRMNKKALARKQGMLIEEGILTGVGETLDGISEAILQMKTMDADQTRVMTFVPQEGTPMDNIPARDSRMEQLIISVLRLVFPDGLIPASLDVDGLDGLGKRLDAGANVVTSIVPPEKGFAGVANSDLDIDDSRRTVESILPILEERSLKIADIKDYRQWIETRKIRNYLDSRFTESLGSLFSGVMDD